jgi:succinate dehydrogenase hydrophobic anchor subunit
LPKGQPEWVVPVIVLSGIVAVVLVIVLIYVIINRPDANHDAYEPINK